MPVAYDGVAVAVPVTVPYERESDKDVPWFVARALFDLVRKAGIEKSDVDGLAVSSFTLKPDPVVALTRSLGITPRWLEDVPFGGASGGIALRRAARAIQAGDAEIVACIGADTNRRDSFQGLVSEFSRAAREGVYPYGALGPNTVFAMITRAYMEQFGATREDFARICLSQRINAAGVPHALLRKPMTLDDYMAARPIAEPLHLFDCVMPCAGAEAFLVMSSERARALKLSHAVIRGAIERHNAYPGDTLPLTGGWAMDRDELYSAAALGPDDIDILETYDDYPVISLLQMEDLGFCEKGEGPAFLRRTALTCHGGGLPHNTSGGQLSSGQAGAAGGYLGMVEALRQLAGEALGDQVPDARTALVSGYGMVIFDRCLATSAVILQGGKS